MRHIVTGYHGTHAAAAEAIVSQQAFHPGNGGWFGCAVYCWEQDQGRATRWATRVLKSIEPGVVRAELDLSRDALDLTVEADQQDYRAFVAGFRQNFPALLEPMMALASENNGFADAFWISLFRQSLAQDDGFTIASLRAMVLEGWQYPRRELNTITPQTDGGALVASSRIVTKVSLMVAIFEPDRISCIERST